MPARAVGGPRAAGERNRWRLVVARGFRERGYGFAWATKLGERRDDSQARLRMARLKTQGFPVCRQRLVVPTARGQRAAEIVVRGRVTGTRRDDAPELPLGIRVAVQVHEGQAESAARFVKVGPQSQGIRVAPGRVGWTAAAHERVSDVAKHVRARRLTAGR